MSGVGTMSDMMSGNAYGWDCRQQYAAAQKRKPEMDTDEDSEGGFTEKKACHQLPCMPSCHQLPCMPSCHQRPFVPSHPDASTLKRMSELALDSSVLSKRARAATHPPRYKSSHVKINLAGKKTYTQQDMELIIKRLTDIHQAELDDQYNTFQTFVDDSIFSHSQHHASYIS